MSFDNFNGIPKTSAIYFTGAGPLDEKSWIDSVNDLANINSQYLIPGMSVICKDTGRVYQWTGSKWIYNLANFVETIDEIGALDTSRVLNGQELTCIENGGHYVYLPNLETTTTPAIGSYWYLREQLTFDLQNKKGSYKMVYSKLDLPTPLYPAKCTWELVDTFDGKAPWVASTLELASTLSGSLPKIEGDVKPCWTDSSGGGAIISFANGVFTSSYTNGRSFFSQASTSGTQRNCIRFKAEDYDKVYTETEKDANEKTIVRPTSAVVHIYQRTL